MLKKDLIRKLKKDIGDDDSIIAISINAEGSVSVSCSGDYDIIALAIAKGTITQVCDMYLKNVLSKMFIDDKTSYQAFKNTINQYPASAYLKKYFDEVESGECSNS